MTTKMTQISAPITPETKAELEAWVEQSGMKKGRVIEDALLHHLRALRELPADVMIPPRIVATRESFERVVLEQLNGPPREIPALRALLSDDD